MHRYFLQLSYKGTTYHGWQVQENAITVQQVLNKKLSIILQEEIQTIGAGRTDKGVHAEYFMLHFDTEKPITDSTLFLDKMNKVLPRDIAVYYLLKVQDEANTRFDALSRTYEYRITRKKNPFLTYLSWYYRVSLNVDLMNQAAKALFEYQDFTSFSKTGTQVKTNNCKIYEAQWFETDSHLLIFRIKADRFLRNMVRAITGTLIDVGREKLSLAEFRKIIESKNRSNAGFSVPAHGLFLTDIEYPEEMLNNKK